MISSAALNAIIEKAVATRVRQQLRSLQLPLSTRVRQQLRNRDNVLPTPPPEQADEFLPQDAITPQTPQTPYTPQEAERPSFGRSLSISSSCSTSTTTSTTEEILDTHLFADSYNEIVNIYRGDKRKLYKEGDKDVVRVPLMQLLDPTLLAPLTSPLFRRFVKKTDPSSLKLNAELVFDDFKNRIRGTVRDLCARTNSADPFLDQRYFWLSLIHI